MLANELLAARFGDRPFQRPSEWHPTVYFRDKRLETPNASDKKKHAPMNYQSL
jgi:hypothetical protein